MSASGLAVNMVVLSHLLFEQVVAAVKDVRQQLCALEVRINVLNLCPFVFSETMKHFSDGLTMLHCVLCQVSQVSKTDAPPHHELVDQNSTMLCVFAVCLFCFVLSADPVAGHWW